MTYKLIDPSFRFAVFLIEETKYKNTNQTQTICFANTYEVSGDGSITFYQIGVQGDKRVKIPVLTYPTGKWSGIALIDDNNQFPVFHKSVSEYADRNGIRTENQVPLMKAKEEVKVAYSNENSNHFVEKKDENHKGEDENSDFNLAFNFFNNENQTKPTMPPQETSQVGNYSYRNNHHDVDNNGNSQRGIPGIVPNMALAEFKKARNELLETQIKEYIKNNAVFDIAEIMNIVNIEAKNQRLGKISETDIVWVASHLIRSKSVQTRKFTDQLLQKQLNFILPDIMKRQWSGKMAPILQILEEREETKNTTAIDLAVWMVQNDFE